MQGKECHRRCLAERGSAALTTIAKQRACNFDNFCAVLQDAIHEPFPEATTEAVPEAPPAKKPRKKLTNIFAIKRFTTSEEVEAIRAHPIASPQDSFATASSAVTQYTDDSALTSGPPTRTVSWDRDGICSDAEAAEGHAAGDETKEKKKRKIFKKLGKKVKKALEPLTHSHTSSSSTKA